MKNKIWTILLFVFLIDCFCICGSSFAGDWHFPVGLSYISGMGDVKDIYEDNLTAQGYYTESIDSIPVGVTFRPYYEIDNGLGFGMDIGPSMLMLGDLDFFSIPLNATCRYTFNHNSKVRPYVRAGLSHNFASGDYVESGETGYFTAAGIELMKNDVFGFGIEAAYDSSEIEFEKWGYSSYTLEKIKPGGFTLTVSVIF